MQAPSKAPTTEVKPKFLLVTLGGRKDGRDHLMQVEMCASSGMQASEDARTMRGVATGNVQWLGQALGAKDTSREYIYIYMRLLRAKHEATTRDRSGPEER